MLAFPSQSFLAKLCASYLLLRCCPTTRLGCKKWVAEPTEVAAVAGGSMETLVAMGFRSAGAEEFVS